MLTFRQRLILAALAAPILTALLYWLDSDPLYPNVWDTVREFLIISVFFLFPIILGVTWFFRRRVRVRGLLKGGFFAIKRLPAERS